MYIYYLRCPCKARPPSCACCPPLILPSSHQQTATAAANSYNSFSQLQSAKAANSYNSFSKLQQLQAATTASVSYNSSSRLKRQTATTASSAVYFNSYSYSQLQNPAFLRYNPEIDKKVTTLGERFLNTFLLIGNYYLNSSMDRYIDRHIYIYIYR